MLANQAGGFFARGKAPTRAGNAHPSLAPYQDFATRDGHVLLAIGNDGNDGQFARFCMAVGEAQRARDERFATNTARVHHRGELLAWMQPLLRSRTSAQWITLLQDKAVPCGPITTIAQAFDDPQVRARGLKVDLPREADDGIACIATVASPLRLSDTPVRYHGAPPALGQHTEEVLMEMGMSKTEIAALRTAGTV